MLIGFSVDWLVWSQFIRSAKLKNILLNSFWVLVSWWYCYWIIFCTNLTQLQSLSLSLFHTLYKLNLLFLQFSKWKFDLNTTLIEVFLLHYYAVSSGKCFNCIFFRIDSHPTEFIWRRIIRFLYCCCVRFFFICLPHFSEKKIKKKSIQIRPIYLKWVIFINKWFRWKKWKLLSSWFM